MATKIETLKKPNGDQVLPRTRAKAVAMENGQTVEAAIEEIKTSSTLPIISSSDAGKFLRVSVEGKWVAETLTDVSEVGV